MGERKSEKGVGDFWTRSVIGERDRLVVFVFSLKFHISNVKCQLVKDTAPLYAVGSSWMDCTLYNFCLLHYYNALISHSLSLIYQPYSSNQLKHLRHFMFHNY